MQIVEVSVVGVRSAVLRLTRRETPLRFEIYPMVHVGEPAFYAAVTERLRRCDLIVAEGVGGNAAVSALTAAYRLPAHFERSGLVEQNIRYASLGKPVRYPDMTGEQFSAGWRAVPFWQRAAAAVASPLVGLEQLAFGSRRMLARGMELTDVDWYDQFGDVDSMEELMSLIGERRDRLLMADLDRIHRTRRLEAITVAVVYGALHVPPVVHGMRALHGYGVRGAEWLTVFGFD
ncbi:hypothetical protein HH310_22700 [Actinoplanes sp. TBRC 11911]|uniref:hypothetical protein n=1 Tax=Actinoplanes sp. TBRC 11911 TaxID=2729386 RepID=UPI00145FB49E|nr:hypothetical protein [Actinoplanes sp. TBRC 11911]NMO53978.1 hypothetical protein [Actinoplanes sp. TBRC 11911]